MCGFAFLVSAPRRCGRRNPRRRWQAAMSRPLSPRSISIRLTTCRRPCGEKTSRRRAAAPCGETVDGAAVMTDTPLDISLTVNGERVSERVEARKTLVDFLRDDLAPHRQPCRLRAWRLRRLHRARRWRDRARLPDAGGAMRRRDGRDHRRPVGLRRACRPAGGLRAAQRAAMRLLHARHADGGAGTAEAAAACRAATTSASIISGNYCRCTGYHAIVDAVEAVAQARAGAKK